MPSTTITPSTAGPAPWRPLFLQHLSKLKSPEFILATVAPADDKSSPTPYIPKVRYCIHRGMFGELPENKHFVGEKNDRVYESDIPTFTTDVRMNKVPEIFASCPGHGDVSQSQGSGGGGPVEAVYWISEVMTQWRISGEAYVIAPDIEGDGEESSGVRTVKSELGKAMRIVDETKKDSWSWYRELEGHFINLSPGMRGSFKNPPPGTPVGSTPGKGEALGQKVGDEGLKDELAKKNFRVVAIRPTVVEMVDLTEPDKARRFRYTHESKKNLTIGDVTIDDGNKIGEWYKEELWP